MILFFAVVISDDFHSSDGEKQMYSDMQSKVRLHLQIKLLLKKKKLF